MRRKENYLVNSKFCDFELNSKTTSKNLKQNVLDKNKGITLVALVVTIVVLLILAGITISLVFSDNGVIAKANQAKELTTRSQTIEIAQLDILSAQLEGDITKTKLEEILGKYGTVKYVDDNSDNDISGLEVEGVSEVIPIEDIYTGEFAEEPPTPIDQTTKVGYYADFEGDGEVDGVIYADLAVGGSGKWNNATNSTYTIPTETNLKDYYVSKENYAGTFGTKDVLTPITATAEGKNDRFYVMALSDLTSGSYTIFYWYYSAYRNGMSDYSTYTSTDFGKGYENTTKMITKWGSSGYGAQNDQDMWKYISTPTRTETNGGWFVPSKEEWSAFGANLGITSSNYTSYGFNNHYWSSSQNSIEGAWDADFGAEGMGNYFVYNTRYVRLSATF